MIKSMTGFGRGEHMQDDKKFLVEIKSVNHRYCDTSIRITKKFSFLEPKIRNFIKKSISRGKIDIYIYYEDNSEESNSVKINTALLKDYINNFDEVCNDYNLKNEKSISFFAKLPDLVKLEEQSIDENFLWKLLYNALENAMGNLIAMRSREGELLRNDLINKLSDLDETTHQIQERSPYIVSEYKVKIEERINELLEKVELDENRIATEVAIFADRCAIDEEITRLKSHISQMKESLDTEKAIGRKLDFLAQEMNREANTIASKSNDIQITQLAIELKANIEKIREQIQNIE